MNPSNDSVDAVIQGCSESCRRLLAVARALTPKQYGERWRNRNGIGPHLRHCYEHLTALMDGMESGVVSYDARERNLLLEQDPQIFIDAMLPVAAWIESLNTSDLDTPLIVCQIPHVDVPEVRSSSTLQRELLFLTSHTIHHLAIVSMLAELHGAVVPDDLGVAYSTTTHEHQQQHIVGRQNAVTT